MQNSWENYDLMVKESIREAYTQNDLLRTHLSVLLVKNMISLNTPFSEVQQLLLARYDVEYSLSDIEDELLMIKKDSFESTKEVEEDYYEGY